MRKGIIAFLLAVSAPALTRAPIAAMPKRTTSADPINQVPPDIVTQRGKLSNTRFSTIKIALQDAVNEIQFWARQLSEHALFLHLGIEDKPLKKQGIIIHKKFEQFRKNIDPESMQSLTEILPLAKELRDYKIQVLSRLNDGEWIGWIFPTFARHIIMELDYFVDKLNGIQYTDHDEILFWNMINGEHAQFAAHLLDPSEQALFEQANNIAEKFANLPKNELEMFRKISLQSAKELDKYNKAAQQRITTNTVKSVIHPVLIKHVIREGQRSIATLKNLTSTEGAIFPPAAPPDMM